MPTYQYACKECGHQFEVVQSFSDSSLTDCPECQGTLRKLFGSVGVIFKGSGFYRTDSRSDSKSNSASNTKPAESSNGSANGSSGSAAKSDSSTKSASGSSSSGASSSGSNTTSTAAAS